MKLNKHFILIILGFLLSSCVKDIDFDQANNYDASPKYIASLVYFKIPAQGFLDASGNEITLPVIDESKLSVMEESVIQDNLKEVVLDFEISNPFGRIISINIQFLDEQGNVTHAINTIEVRGNTSSFKHKETISISSSPQFLNTRRIKVSLQLSTVVGTPILASDLNEFVFKSAGTLTFKI